jgi:hypothetical protein
LVEIIIIMIVKIRPKSNIKILNCILSQLQHLNLEDCVNEPFYLKLNKSQASHRPPECPIAHKSLDV